MKSIKERYFDDFTTENWVPIISPIRFCVALKVIFSTVVLIPCDLYCRIENWPN